MFAFRAGWLLPLYWVGSGLIVAVAVRWKHLIKQTPPPFTRADTTSTAGLVAWRRARYVVVKTVKTRRPTCVREGPVRHLSFVWRVRSLVVQNAGSASAADLPPTGCLLCGQIFITSRARTHTHTQFTEHRTELAVSNVYSVADLQSTKRQNCRYRLSGVLYCLMSFC